MAHQLVLLSGPPNAGKSATAEALCERYDRMLHVEVGTLRDFLRMGRLRPWDATPEGRDQRALLIGSACDMARRFLDAGYGVVIDDVITPDDLPLYQQALTGVAQATHFVVLLPSLDAVLAREQTRSTEWQRGGHLEYVYGRFEDWASVAVVAPADLTPALVADRVMALAAEGKALLAGDQNAK